jgi:hypothetical protein
MSRDGLVASGQTGERGIARCDDERDRGSAESDGIGNAPSRLASDRQGQGI